MKRRLPGNAGGIFRLPIVYTLVPHSLAPGTARWRLLVASERRGTAKSTPANNGVSGSRPAGPGLPPPARAVAFSDGYHGVHRPTPRAGSTAGAAGALPCPRNEQEDADRRRRSGAAAATTRSTFCGARDNDLRAAFPASRRDQTSCQLQSTPRRRPERRETFAGGNAAPLTADCCVFGGEHGVRKGARAGGDDHWGGDLHQNT